MKIRFYGLYASLLLWRTIVVQATGKEGGVILEKQGRHYFDVQLTKQDRDTLQRDYWRKESGTGELANGMPYRWNDCIGYEEIKGRRK